MDFRPGPSVPSTCFKWTEPRPLPPGMKWRCCLRSPVADVRFIVRRALSGDAIARAEHGPDRGALVTFARYVRPHQDGREDLRLKYSAYEPKAEAERRRIVEEASVRWTVVV